MVHEVPMAFSVSAVTHARRRIPQGKRVENAGARKSNQETSIELLYA